MVSRDSVSVDNMTRTRAKMQRTMKRLLTSLMIVPAILFIGVAGCAENNNQPIGVIDPVAAEIGKLAPDFTLPGPDGTKISLSDFRGKVVYLDFWASWCPPCLAALPGLKRIWTEYQTEDFVILGVSLDYTNGDWRNFLGTEPDMTWPQTYDEPLTVANMYGVRGIPHTFMIDSSGTLVKSNRGGTSEPVLRDELDALFRE